MKEDLPILRTFWVHDRIQSAGNSLQHVLIDDISIYFCLFRLHFLSYELFTQPIFRMLFLIWQVCRGCSWFVFWLIRVHSFCSEIVKALISGVFLWASLVIFNHVGWYDSWCGRQSLVERKSSALVSGGLQFRSKKCFQVLTSVNALQRRVLNPQP